MSDSNVQDLLTHTALHQLHASVDICTSQSKQELMCLAQGHGNPMQMQVTEISEKNELQKMNQSIPLSASNESTNGNQKRNLNYAKVALNRTHPAFSNRCHYLCKRESITTML